MKLRALIVLVAMLGLTVGAMTASGEAAPSTDYQVSVVDFAFAPQRLRARVGDSVTWTNNGNAPHTTRALGGAWNSGTLNPGDDFTFTFTSAGQFKYRCQFHAQMKAMILVQA